MTELEDHIVQEGNDLTTEGKKRLRRMQETAEIIGVILDFHSEDSVRTKITLRIKIK